MSEFFEAIWHGEGVGDGGDLEEALQAYVAVKPEEGDWVEVIPLWALLSPAFGQAH